MKNEIFGNFQNEKLPQSLFAVSHHYKDVKNRNIFSILLSSMSFYVSLGNFEGQQVYFDESLLCFCISYIYFSVMYIYGQLFGPVVVR